MAQPCPLNLISSTLPSAPNFNPRSIKQVIRGLYEAANGRRAETRLGLVAIVPPVAPFWLLAKVSRPRGRKFPDDPKAITALRVGSPADIHSPITPGAT